MKRLILLIVVTISTLCLVACQNMNNQDVGMAAGGVAGGLIGSTVGAGNGRLVAIAAGTLAGAMLGGSVGRNMDENDKARMNAALENNNAGQPAYWNNTKTGTSYKVTPVKNVSINGNKYCREYRTTAIINGKQQQMYGKACRQPDGSWKAVS